MPLAAPQNPFNGQAIHRQKSCTRSWNQSAWLEVYTYMQISDSEWLDSCRLSLLEEEGFTGYMFPGIMDPLSHELMQMNDLQHEVCWSNSRQQYTHLIWWVWHPRFSAPDAGFKSCISVTSKTTLDNIMLLACKSHLKTSTNHYNNLIWVNSLFKRNQSMKTSPDIFPSGKKNNQACISWLSDIRGVERMIVYAT